MTVNIDSADADAGRRSASGAVDDLVLVSNREPYRHEYADDGEGVDVDTPAGGLAIGIDPVMQRVDGTWIAWGDGEADFDVADDAGRVEVPPSDPAYTLRRLRLSEEQVRGYYDGYANQALWPLCHTDTGRVNFDADHWAHYREVNERFADAIVDNADRDTTVWFQDYHFMLAPRSVRARVPDAFLMHFFHIPWPAPDVFRICPQAETLLRGILGNDLIGFHRPRYGAQFLKCVDQLLDEATVDWAAREVHYDGHATTVDAFPFSVDADDVRRCAEAADGSFWSRFRDHHGIDEDTSVAVGVDRLDYTKGIPQRLDALEHLFETRPELRGELTYVQKASTTRERIPAYQELREEVESRVARVNDRFGTDDWTPVVYTTEMFDRENLFSLYRHADVALVTPLRDGMNLVAKEYVASQIDDDGALVLSPMTGAFEELGDQAVECDPYDTPTAADAIERALELDEAERRSRMRELRSRVHEADLSRWLEEVLDAAATVHEDRAASR